MYSTSASIGFQSIGFLPPYYFASTLFIEWWELQLRQCERTYYVVNQYGPTKIIHICTYNRYKINCKWLCKNITKAPSCFKYSTHALSINVALLQCIGLFLSKCLAILSLWTITVCIVILQTMRVNSAQTATMCTSAVTVLLDGRDVSWES